jgi:hypothetical protein
MDHTMLWKWLKAGFVDKQVLSPTEADLYPYFLRFGGAGRMIQYMVVRSVRC